MTATNNTWKTNLRDANRWRNELMRMAVWLGGALFCFTALGKYVPGELVAVITNSIPRGLYWVDHRAFEPARGQYVTLKFIPEQAWIAERYAKPNDSRRHTKSIGALPGDVILADNEQNYYACSVVASVEPGSMVPNAGQDILPGRQCESLGRPQAKDSQGLEMTGWLGPGQQYEIKPDEVWIYGPNPRSLDSRYYGPLPKSHLVGETIALIQID